MTLCLLLSIPSALFVAIYHKFVQYGMASCSFGVVPETFEDFAGSLENSVPCVVKSSIFGVDFVWFNIVVFSVIFIFFLILQIFSLTKKKL